MVRNSNWRLRNSKEIVSKVQQSDGRGITYLYVTVTRPHPDAQLTHARMLARRSADSSNLERFGSKFELKTSKLVASFKTGFAARYDFRTIDVSKFEHSARSE